MTAAALDLAAHPGAVWVRRKPITRHVAFAEAAGICATLEGPVHYAAGDAIVTGEHGERWPVRRAQFLHAYTPAAATPPGVSGLYEKVARDVLALCLDSRVDLTIEPGGDQLAGERGDWLIDYRDGSHGIVRADIFAQTYEPAGR